MEYSVVGKSLPKIDAPAKAKGETIFTTDLRLPGMLHGRILRSPLPHARLLNVDASRALRLPGVKAVVTGAETPITFGYLPNTADQYPLARDKVRYIGDEVAAVAAVDEDTAEHALSLIQVDYEELPAVFDPVEALREGAPQIHDNVPGNVGGEFKMNFGDVEAAFAAADFVREDRFVTAAVTHCPLEGHAAVASWDAGGRLTLWTSTQNPFLVRRNLTRSLGIPDHKLRLVVPPVGGGFGGKIEAFANEYASILLAQKAGRPVRLALSREEVFCATRRRIPLIIDMKTGVKKDGAIVGLDTKVVADGGAYLSTGMLVLFHGGAYLVLPFRMPNVRYEGYRAYTNLPPSGAQRGHGVPQMRYAFESQLDMLAEELGLDPVEVRLRNAVQTGDRTVNGWEVNSCGLTECIKGVAKPADPEKRLHRRKSSRGWGMGCGGFISGPKMVPGFVSTALIKLDQDGNVALLTGAVDIGQGSNTILGQIAAEELGVKLDQVNVIASDTGVTPIELCTGASRVTMWTGNAVKNAAANAKAQLMEVVAEKLECRAEDLEARDGRYYVKGSPEKGLSFADVMKVAIQAERIPLVAKGSYSADLKPPNIRTGEGNLSPAYSFSAHAAEVEVDRETGEVRVLRVVSAHDCGRAVNPMLVEAQLDGSVSGGLGQALLEEMRWDRGQLLNPSLLDYHQPTVDTMPEMDSVIIETDDPAGPFGAKEAGEGSQLSTVPAIVNAIYDAVGVRITKLPVNPETLLRALEKQKG
ncbi:MAG: molybdopterin-dependent oxidoreductase [Dehalococcoidia bacterium]|nr:molybdopterin-dependent oxidoreductase [Dehalococcoidia bacterium]